MVKKAWVHRKGKATWQFEWNGSSFENFGRERSYYIIQEAFKFYIVSSYNEDVDVTQKIRAYKIEFDDGSEYYFPGSDRYRR